MTQLNYPQVRKIKGLAKEKEMKLPGLKSRVSFGLPGFAGLPTLRSGRHSSPGLKAWGFLAGFIKGSLKGGVDNPLHINF